MIAKTLAAAAMLFQAVAPASSPPREDKWLVMMEPRSAEAIHITARFLCESKTVEVSYLQANLEGGKPWAGFYVERIFVNDRPIAIRDLQRINSAIDGRQIVRVSQPYCEAGGAAWVPTVNVEPPRLGKDEHALAIFMYAASKTDKIERQSIEVRFDGLTIREIVGDITK